MELCFFFVNEKGRTDPNFALFNVPALCCAENIPDLTWAIWGNETDFSLEVRTWALVADQPPQPIPQQRGEGEKKIIEFW